MNETEDEAKVKVDNCSSTSESDTIVVDVNAGSEFLCADKN